MPGSLIAADHHSDLLAIIRQVRRRWRLKLALGGAATALAAGLLALLASAYGLEFFKFAAPAIIAFRILIALVFGALVVFFLAPPLLRRPSDEQVALYLEEHEPSLDAAIVSAIEAAKRSPPDRNPISDSPALMRRLIEAAIVRCQSSGPHQRIEQADLRRYAIALGVVVAAAVGLFVSGPAYLRHGVSALLLFSQSVEAASPYRIDVRPGNTTVPRGSDQTITARLVGFEAEQVELLVRKAANAPFERLPFVRGEGGAFDAMLFDLDGPVDYFIESAGVRSSLYRLEVVDLPYVRRLELEYHFPAYTGLKPQKIDNGGDIVAPRGTEVRLRAIPTIPPTAGSLLFDDKSVVPLGREADGSLTARFPVNRDGFYRIELNAPHGERVAASPQYTIDVLADQSPSVSFVKPGRDVRAAPLDEVFVQARADDDYGVRELHLVYSVNGGAEKSIRLSGAAGRPLREVSAGHTFYLEELGLSPGDFVSYYGRVSDNDQVQGPKVTTSDLYFMQIRPFRKDFRPATSQGGGGGGGGAEVGALSQQQRQIISATFNVARDRKTYSADKLREHVVLIALAQARLREQVEGLVERMNSRLVEPDPAFRKIAEILPQAAAEMRAAEEKLQARSPDAALPPEQRALQHLQKAEEEYELQVSVTRNAGAGGGGAGSIAEDLADLFELELDKLANQYETTERAGRQNADQQMDELMERLKDLARRQEQEAERQRRRAAAGQGGQGGGAAQRALAEQAEEAARRLERLSRDENRPDLMDAARRLQEAANAMRRAAANGDPNAAAQAGAALERLREAERQLQRRQSARGGRDLQDALGRADELAREQREIAGEVDELPRAGASRPERVRRLTERKDALESNVADLERQLDRTANDIRRDQRDSARKLEQAAGSIRDNKIKEKIRYSKGIIQGSTPEYARGFEEDISSNLDAMRQKIAEASAALGASKGDRMADALEKARELAQGMESLDRRMRERAEQGGGQNAGADDGQARGAGRQSPGDRRGTSTSIQRGEGQRGDGDTMGPFGRGDGYGSRRPGPWGFTDEEIRQFRGEIREWSAAARELRRQLSEQGVDVADLDEIARALRALDSERVYHDAAELERLQTFVTEGLKRFEYGLRRRAEADGQQLFLSGSDEVPAGFRELVAEYYRSLAKRR